MSYAFIQDVPADEAMYREVRQLLPDAAPRGLVAHLAIKRAAGLRYIDVWETEADWVTFRDEHVEPAVDKVLAARNIPHDHSMVHAETIEVIDAWLGTAR